MDDCYYKKMDLLLFLFLTIELFCDTVDILVRFLPNLPRESKRLIWDGVVETFLFLQALQIGWRD